MLLVLKGEKMADVILQITQLETNISSWISVLNNPETTCPVYGEVVTHLKEEMNKGKESMEEIKEKIQYNIDDHTYEQARKVMLEKDIFHLDKKEKEIREKTQRCD